jgi:3-oxoacyl-[acyl-carrier protein] reductase
VVSGCGTGMGKAITARLVGGGGHVVIIGRRAHVLEMSAGELNAAGPGTVSWQSAGLSSPQDPGTRSEEILRRELRRPGE